MNLILFSVENARSAGGGGEGSTTTATSTNKKIKVKKTSRKKKKKISRRMLGGNSTKRKVVRVPLLTRPLRSVTPRDGGAATPGSSTAGRAPAHGRRQGGSRCVSFSGSKAGRKKKKKKKKRKKKKKKKKKKKLAQEFIFRHPLTLYWIPGADIDCNV
jgi:hypothetical protein